MIGYGGSIGAIGAFIGGTGNGLIRHTSDSTGSGTDPMSTVLGLSGIAEAVADGASRIGAGGAAGRFGVGGGNSKTEPYIRLVVQGEAETIQKEGGLVGTAGRPGGFTRIFPADQYNRYAGDPMFGDRTHVVTIDLRDGWRGSIIARDGGGSLGGLIVGVSEINEAIEKITVRPINGGAK